ncbi:MAG: hypothetical protein KIT84_41500 [Labilithrix sp.]|nr:hypothetical protein [Labilithrix sp.]MCW5817548.1 hypothetical protein [Labilithrix sp.]
MRFAVLLPGSLIVCAVALYACSSSDEATPTPDAGKTSSSSTSSSTSGSNGDDDDDDNTSSSSSSSSGDTSSSSSSSSGGGGGGDGGGGGGGDGGGGGGGDGGGGVSSKCLTGDTREVEPNDSAGAAQVIPATTGTSSLKYCGRIAAAGDVDFITWTFNVTGSVSISGAQENTGNGLQITLKVGGGAEQPFSGSIPLQSGQPYLFKVTATGQSDYRFNLDVTQN